MLNTILLLEDHKDTRAWFSEILQLTFKDCHILEAENLKQARKLLNKNKFSIAIIDLNLPDGSGVDIISKIKQSSNETYVVVATIFDDDDHIFKALQAGAQGYLLKQQPKEQLLLRLKGIINDEPPLSPSIARKIMQHFNNPPPCEQENTLTAREKEVLTIIAKGMSRADISRLLGITVNTVSGHIKNIYRKLNICTRAEAALEASRMGLLNG